MVAMTSVVELFPRSRKLSYDLQQQLREVEAKRMSPSDMDLGLEELKRQTQMLETLVEQEVREGRIETRVETPLSRRPP